jgi:hypothetical protein
VRPQAANKPVAEPPSSWQQAARAMYEGEQQVPRDPRNLPVEEARPVIAVPVMPMPPEPLTGTEVARTARAEPPTSYVKGEPPDSAERERSPASDQAQFEWRREQPHQAPPPPPSNGNGSTVSVNTTIVVEGAGDDVVVENAVRVSLGNKNKKTKSDAIEKFAEGEELDDTRVQMAPVEGLLDFVAEDPELRAVLQHLAPSAESIQWPKFPVTPMRRRIAFGPPAKGSLFGGPAGQVSPRPSSMEAKPLPPKKSVGFLFKKLTNS